MKVQLKKEYVQPTVRGQITIPSTMRKLLGINTESLIEVILSDQSLTLKPIHLDLSQPKEKWETVVDFRDIAPDGVKLDHLVRKLQQWTKSKKRSGN